MKRGLFLIGLCLAVGIATFGCGSSSNNGNGIVNSPYAGAYVGSFAYNGGGVGEFSIYITSNGKVTGRGVNVTFPAAQTLSGTIYNTGQILVTSNGTAGSISYSGNLALTPGNTLTGTLRGLNGNTTTIAVSAPTIASGSTFAGSYSGTFTSNSQNNTLTLIIDAGGNITGVDDNTTATTFSTLSGTVQSNGTVSMTSSSGGGTITGTFTLASATLTASLNGSGGLPVNTTLKQDAQ